MLEVAEGWVRQRGLDNLLGSCHLDYEDSYRVLIEGRDGPPVVQCGHTSPYYEDYFEAMGFESARGDALAYEMGLSAKSKPLQRLHRLGDYRRRRGSVSLRGADLTHWQRVAELIFGLINRVLAHLTNLIPWPEEAFP